MAKFCHELDIDLWEVIRAASTKPFGFQAFYPGPGVGGHCIPIDPNYLSYEVQRKLGYPFRFVELAEEVNNSMPRYVVERIQDALNDRERSVRGASVLLLGVSYKANIADERESPAVDVGVLLAAKGAHIEYHDPRILNWRVGDTKLESVSDLEGSVARADIVVLLQNHAEYDVDRLASQSRLFFDSRGVSTSASAIRL
jgi:nucleotide sugar dehydrogenase